MLQKYIGIDLHSPSDELTHASSTNGSSRMRLYGNLTTVFSTFQFQNGGH